MQFETNKKIIGEKIKKYRKFKHLTRAQLAEKVDLNEKQIYRIESGLNYPTYLTFVKLVKCLDINIKDLMINTYIEINPLRDNLNSLIKTANNAELKMYLDVIVSINENIGELKKNSN